MREGGTSCLSVSRQSHAWAGGGDPSADEAKTQFVYDFGVSLCKARRPDCLYGQYITFTFPIDVTVANVYGSNSPTSTVIVDDIDSFPEASIDALAHRTTIIHFGREPFGGWPPAQRQQQSQRPTQELEAAPWDPNAWQLPALLQDVHPKPAQHYNYGRRLNWAKAGAATAATATGATISETAQAPTEEGPQTVHVQMQGTFSLSGPNAAHNQAFGRLPPVRALCQTAEQRAMTIARLRLAYTPSPMDPPFMPLLPAPPPAPWPPAPPSASAQASPSPPTQQQHAATSGSSAYYYGQDREYSSTVEQWMSYSDAAPPSPPPPIARLKALLHHEELHWKEQARRDRSEADAQSASTSLGVAAGVGGAFLVFAFVGLFRRRTAAGALTPVEEMAAAKGGDGMTVSGGMIRGFWSKHQPLRQDVPPEGVVELGRLRGAQPHADDEEAPGASQWL